MLLSDLTPLDRSIISLIINYSHLCYRSEEGRRNEEEGRWEEEGGRRERREDKGRRTKEGGQRTEEGGKEEEARKVGKRKVEGGGRNEEEGRWWMGWGQHRVVEALCWIRVRDRIEVRSREAGPPRREEGWVSEKG